LLYFDLDIIPKLFQDDRNVTFEIAQINDIDGVLALQELYLVANLTEEKLLDL
jgi:hypothetical protein